MPFPHIHEAVSEQLLLLIFKARRLYLDPEYRPWFDEQHRILSALRANTKLQSILEKQRELLHKLRPIIHYLKICMLLFRLCAIYTMVLITDSSA